MQKAEPQKPEKTNVESKSCVFGKEILEVCPVRAMLDSKPNDPMNKYLATPTGMAGDFKSIMDDMKAVMSSSFNTLALFCKACPHQHVWVENKRRL